jgi:hypothetical protein
MFGFCNVWASVCMVVLCVGVCVCGVVGVWVCVCVCVWGGFLMCRCVYVCVL